MVESNYEYGRGRPDVVVMDDETRSAMVLEIKHARSEDDVDAKCEEAVQQIAERRYLDGIERGYRNRIAYGVVFFEKDCYIVKAGEQKLPKNRVPGKR